MKQHELELRRDGIGLFPIMAEDHGFLYTCAISERNSLLWRYHGQIPPFDMFVNQLYATAFVQFVVRRLDDGERLGHVVAYSANMQSRHVHVGAVMSEAAQRQGMGVTALELIIDYLFAVWDLRAVYAEVPQYTADPTHDNATLNSRLPFVLTGRRPEFHYHQGRYWDDLIFHLPRERWEQRAELTRVIEVDGNGTGR